MEYLEFENQLRERLTDGLMAIPLLLNNGKVIQGRFWVARNGRVAMLGKNKRRSGKYINDEFASQVKEFRMPAPSIFRGTAYEGFMYRLIFEMVPQMDDRYFGHTAAEHLRRLTALGLEQGSLLLYRLTDDSVDSKKASNFCARLLGDGMMLPNKLLDIIHLGYRYSVFKPYFPNKGKKKEFQDIVEMLDGNVEKAPDFHYTDGTKTDYEYRLIKEGDEWHVTLTVDSSGISKRYRMLNADAAILWPSNKL